MFNELIYISEDKNVIVNRRTEYVSAGGVLVIPKLVIFPGSYMKLADRIYYSRTKKKKNVYGTETTRVNKEWDDFFFFALSTAYITKRFSFRSISITRYTREIRIYNCYFFLTHTLIICLPHNAFYTRT